MHSQLRPPSSASHTLLPLLALCALTTALGQEAPAPRADTATLAKYDQNKNGALDADELSALRADEAKAAAAPATSAAGNTENRDVVQMSPFEVSSAEDRGYYASNTLSGTRINSKLEDLGSSITVVTKEQMKDFALLDVNDLFLYEAGTEGTGNYTDFSIDRNGVVTDNVAADPNNANRIRGMGAANQSRGNFATSGRVPVDPIDADAVEISRGPNSNIFGLGNASGTVNIIPTRANPQRQTTAIELRADSYGGTRASIDHNRPLIENKLAVRASAVFQKDEFQRKPSVSRSERYNAMVTWRPFQSTTLRGSFQYYENFARRPNFILPRDGISHWEASGRPTWNAATSTVTRNGVSTVVPYNSNQGRETTALGAGLQTGGSGLYARPSLFVNSDGTIDLWIVGRQSGLEPGTNQPTPNRQSGNARLVESAPPPRQGPLWQTATSIIDQSIYDWETINLGAPNWNENEVRNYTVELEQFFLRTPRQLLATQLAWNREDAQNYNRSFIGTSGSSPMIVYVDVNETLPDGRTNPYFLRPYLTALEPTAGRNPLVSDRYRGQVAYQLNLSRENNLLRWLGDHSLSGYAEYRDTIRGTQRYRDAIVSEHDWIAPGTSRAEGPAAARGYYRYYIGDADGLDIDSSPPAWDTSQGTYQFNWYNAATQQWVAEEATIGEAFASAWQFRNLIKTQGLVTQNHLLRGRIVTTFGWRKDENLNRESARATLNPDGITGDLSGTEAWPQDWLLRREGRTKTAGVVVKPFRAWSAIDGASFAGGAKGFLADAARSLTLHYNESDSFLPASVAQNLVGELLPDPRGQGEDYGFSLSLFKDRLILRYNQYENTQVNSRFGDSGTIASRARRIDFSNTSGGSDRFNLYRNAREWVSQQNPTWTPEQVELEVADQMGFPPDQLARFNSLPISDTSDVTAKGKEIEINYNPNNFFTARVTVTQNQTIDNNLSPAIIRYIESRMPVWQSIIDPRDGEPWFTNRYGSGTAEEFLNGVVLAPYKLAVANEGKTKSQIREWRVNAFGRLHLAGITENKWLKRVSVTGAIRWEDQASIGYYTFDNDPNAFDPNRPIFDEPHTYIDVGASYTTRVFDDRARMRVQLNIRNVTESGRLQPIGALPNGVPHSYRIVDPRMAILTVGFDL